MLERIWGPVLAGQDWLSSDIAVPVLARKNRAAITNSVPNGTIGVKVENPISIQVRRSSRTIRLLLRL
jgi:hypothetical protein